MESSWLSFSFSSPGLFHFAFLGCSVLVFNQCAHFFIPPMLYSSEQYLLKIGFWKTKEHSRPKGMAF